MSLSTVSAWAGACTAFAMQSRPATLDISVRVVHAQRERRLALDVAHQQVEEVGDDADHHEANRGTEQNSQCCAETLHT